MEKNEVEINDLANSRMLMSVKLKVLISNGLLCTILCIYAHTLWPVLLFVYIHLIVMRLSIKGEASLTLDGKHFTKMPPMMNRWHW